MDAGRRTRHSDINNIIRRPLNRINIPSSLAASWPMARGLMDRRFALGIGAAGRWYNSRGHFL